MSVLQRIAIAALVVGGLGHAGCVERTITITSDPPYALVWLNDEEIGRTPVTVPFTFYGKYDVRLIHEGQWKSRQAAAEAMQITPEQLEALIDDGFIDIARVRDEERVRVPYLPLTTAQRARPPVWDAPGLDLFAEITPGRKYVDLDWHFELERATPVDAEILIWHARQMRALIERPQEVEDGQTPPASPPQAPPDDGPDAAQPMEAPTPQSQSPMQ